MCRSLGRSISDRGCDFASLLSRCGGLLLLLLSLESILSEPQGETPISSINATYQGRSSAFNFTPLGLGRTYIELAFSMSKHRVSMWLSLVEAKNPNYVIGLPCLIGYCRAGGGICTEQLGLTALATPEEVVQEIIWGLLLTCPQWIYTTGDLRKGRHLNWADRCWCLLT